MQNNSNYSVNEEREHYKISAKVVDRENGMQEFDDIRLIRVVSDNHNVLIMEDYMPVIGEIKGKVEIVTNDKVIPFDPITGFYMHKKNCFYLLIEEHSINKNNDNLENKDEIIEELHL